MLLNLAAVVMLGYSSHIRPPLKLALVNMALSDLFTMTVAAVWGPDFPCWPALFSLSSGILVSYFMTTLLALHNFVAVFYPVRYEQIISLYRSLILVVLFWLGGHLIILAFLGVDLPAGSSCYVIAVLSRCGIIVVSSICLLCCCFVIVTNVCVLIHIRRRPLKNANSISKSPQEVAGTSIENGWTGNGRVRLWPNKSHAVAPTSLLLPRISVLCGSRTPGRQEALQASKTTVSFLKQDSQPQQAPQTNVLDRKLETIPENSHCRGQDSYKDMQGIPDSVINFNGINQEKRALKNTQDLQLRSSEDTNARNGISPQVPISASLSFKQTYTAEGDHQTSNTPDLAPKTSKQNDSTLRFAEESMDHSGKHHVNKIKKVDGLSLLPLEVEATGNELGKAKCAESIPKLQSKKGEAIHTSPVEEYGETARRRQSSSGVNSDKQKESIGRQGYFSAQSQEIKLGEIEDIDFGKIETGFDRSRHSRTRDFKNSGNYRNSEVYSVSRQISNPGMDKKDTDCSFDLYNFFGGKLKGKKYNVNQGHFTSQVPREISSKIAWGEKGNINDHNTPVLLRFENPIESNQVQKCLHEQEAIEEGQSNVDGSCETSKIPPEYLDENGLVREDDISCCSSASSSNNIQLDTLKPDSISQKDIVFLGCNHSRKHDVPSKLCSKSTTSSQKEDHLIADAHNTPSPKLSTDFYGTSEHCPNQHKTDAPRERLSRHSAFDLQRLKSAFNRSSSNTQLERRSWRHRTQHTLMILCSWCCFLSLPYVIYGGYVAIWIEDRAGFTGSRFGMLVSCLALLNAVTNPLLYTWRFVDWKAMREKWQRKLRNFKFNR